MINYDIGVVFTFFMQITHSYSFCHKICSRRLIFMIPNAQYLSIRVYGKY